MSDIVVVIRQPIHFHTRFSVTSSMNRVTPVSLTYRSIGINLTPGQYLLLDGSSFGTLSIESLGNSFNNLIRVAVTNDDIPFNATTATNILVWSSANDWAIFTRMSQVFLFADHFFNVSVVASSGVIRRNAAIYFGDATEWPTTDDGTLADIIQ